jgi:hypothetical protein
MFQLLYVSTATKPFNDTDLVVLLKAARQKNARLHINGMLLYKQGKFMQILEGEESAVRKLYAEISQDPRHGELTVILERQCSTSVFKDWSMGFANLRDDLIKTLPGYNHFLNTPLDSTHFVSDPTLSMQFLNIFKHAKSPDSL